MNGSYFVNYFISDNVFIHIACVFSEFHQPMIKCLANVSYAMVRGYCSHVHFQVKHLNIGPNSFKKYENQLDEKCSLDTKKNVGRSIPHLVYGSEKLYNEDFQIQTEHTVLSSLRQCFFKLVN